MRPPPTEPLGSHLKVYYSTSIFHLAHFNETKTSPALCRHGRVSRPLLPARSSRPLSQPKALPPFVACESSLPVVGGESVPALCRQRKPAPFAGREEFSALCRLGRLSRPLSLVKVFQLIVAGPTFPHSVVGQYTTTSICSTTKKHMSNSPAQVGLCFDFFLA